MVSLTPEMRTEAADAGRFTSNLWHDKDYPRIQILTVERSAQRHRARRCPAPDRSIRYAGARISSGKADRASMRVVT
jgi:hypothetical protein